MIYSWATVTAVNPLRVRRDLDTEVLDVDVDTLVGGLVVGDRVYVQLTGNKPVILGRAGG